MTGKRVWNVDFGFGTVLQDNGQTLLIRWDCDPWFPCEVDLRKVTPAGWVER